MRKNLIKVFEHEVLKTGTKGFQQKHLDSLIKYNDKTGNKFFTPVYKGIKFNSYVGIVHVAGLTIEILPKADKAKNNEANEDKWHNVLLNMLRVCRLLKKESISRADLRLRANSLLELYFELFLEEAEQLVKRGLVKKYRRTEGNLNVLKGRLVFNQHLKKNFIHKEKFYTSYQVYDREHLLNQILVQTLKLIRDISPAPFHADKVNRLLLDLPEMPELKPSTALFDKVKFGRKTEAYKEAISIARLLLLNFSPDIKGGADNVLAILFDMNKLWEEYVYRMLQREQREGGFTVLGQRSRTFWRNKKVRADILLEKEGQIFVLDTKWKVVENSAPSDDDLKQMYAYNHCYDADLSLLVYPHAGQGEENPEYFQYTYRGNKYSEDSKLRDHKCGMVFLRVVDEVGGLREKITKELIKTIS